MLPNLQKSTKPNFFEISTKCTERALYNQNTLIDFLSSYIMAGEIIWFTDFLLSSFHAVKAIINHISQTLLVSSLKMMISLIKQVYQ